MITITVNGQRHDIDADPNMPLLWVIRDILGLTGTKYGCGAAQCGACTVHLNGEAVRFVRKPTGKPKASGNSIVTIEGLSASNNHPFATGMERNECTLSRYNCPNRATSMSAAVLVRENPNPTDQDIDDAMSGNASAGAEHISASALRYIKRQPCRRKGPNYEKIYRHKWHRINSRLDDPGIQNGAGENQYLCYFTLRFGVGSTSFTVCFIKEVLMSPRCMNCPPLRRRSIYKEMISHIHTMNVKRGIDGKTWPIFRALQQLSPGRKNGRLTHATRKPQMGVTASQNANGVSRAVRHQPDCALQLL